MDRARLPQAAPGDPEGIVWAGHVDPKAPPKGMLCACFECSAQVHFVSGGLIKGGRYTRMPHFGTDPGQLEQHVQNCPFVSDYNPDITDQSLKEAVRDGKFVLINLNMDLSRRKFSNMVDQWCASHAGRYVAISVRSAQEYLDVRNRLVCAGGQDALDRVKVSHGGHIISQAQFELGDDKHKIINAYNCLKDVQGRDYPEFRMPRMLIFTPTKRARTLEAGAKSISGTFVKLDQKSSVDLVLLNRLCPRDSNQQNNLEMQAHITAGGRVCVIARPWINAADDARQREAFYHRDPQNTIFTHIGWTVFSPTQVSLASDLIASPQPEAAPVRTSSFAAAASSVPGRQAGLVQPSSRPTRAQQELTLFSRTLYI